MDQGSPRLPIIDALKALGSQLIVLHHLAFYGPMSDWTYDWLPGLVEWLSQDARMAVQVFLVAGGFLAARGLAPEGVLLGAEPHLRLLARYLRVTLPFVAALLVAIACNELARLWMEHHSVPEPVGPAQLLAHALLLHTLLGYDSLAAGVWYVAIDFQLFALLLALLWLARLYGGPDHAGQVRTQGAAGLLVAGLGLASLFWFNRDPAWDPWALYFFGSYALGVVASWSTRPNAGRAWRWLLAAMVAGTVLALAAELRGRIALSLGVAALLGAAQWGDWGKTWPRSRLLDYLGRISYSVFLLNFPIALVVNAAFTRFAPADPLVQTGGVLAAWLACNLAGAIFYHQVESRLRRVIPGLPIQIRKPER